MSQNLHFNNTGKDERKSVIVIVNYCTCNISFTSALNECSPTCLYFLSWYLSTAQIQTISSDMQMDEGRPVDNTYKHTHDCILVFSSYTSIQ